MSDLKQQTTDLLEKLAIKFSSKYVSKENIYQLTLSRLLKGQRRSITIRLAQSAPNIDLSSYSLLEALTKYDPGSFESYCLKYGLNDDSRRVYNTHRNIVREWKKVSRFFSEAELNLIREMYNNRRESES